MVSVCAETFHPVAAKFLVQFVRIVSVVADQIPGTFWNYLSLRNRPRSIRFRNEKQQLKRGDAP